MVKALGIIGKSRFGGEKVFLQKVEPTVDDRVQRAGRHISCRQPFDQTSVDRLHSMQWRLSFRDLHLAGGKAFRAGPFLEPAAEEGLARSVLAPNRLERRATQGDRFQFAVEGALEAVHANGEDVEAGFGHGPTAKGVDDLGSTARAQHRLTP